MKASIRSKLVLTFITMILLAGVIAISLSNVSFRVHAQDTGSLKSHMSQTSNQTDWPIIGYDLQHTGYNPNETVLNPTNISHLTVDWQATTSGGISLTSSPIIANGIVYIGDDTGTLYAYDATMGTLLWSYFTRAQSIPSLTVVNGVAYVTDDINLAALDAKTGSELWYTRMRVGTSFVVGRTNFSPAVVNNIIYVSLDSSTDSSTNDGSLAAFNATDGSLLWNQHVADYVSGSPAIVNGVVYITASNNSGSPGNVYALDAQTGNILWSGSLPDGAAASGVAVSNGIVYINANTITSLSSNLYAFDAVGCGSATCSPLWVVPEGALYRGSNVPTPAIANGVVYIGSPLSNGSEIMYAFNAKTGATLWTWTSSSVTEYGFASSAAVANGVVYIVDHLGNVYAFNASGCGSATCSPLWTMGNMTASPVVVNGMVYIGGTVSGSSSSGILFAFHLPSTRKLFVLLQGLTSSLSQNAFWDTGSIGPYLQAKFPEANFLTFSYKGDDGHGNPQDYGCIDTFNQHIGTYVGLLNTQLQDYLANRPNTDVYLIGHSLGGVIAVGYLAGLDATGGLKGDIPGTNGDKIKGVVTLDSPLGGIEGGLNGLYELATLHFYYESLQACQGLNKADHYSLDDLTRFYSNNTPRGGQDSISQLLYGNSITNESLLQAAEQDGTASLTIGNYLDYTYHAQECFPLQLLGPAFLDTQWVQDLGNTSGVYGRYFSDGIFPCSAGLVRNIKADLTNIGENHGIVLTESSVHYAIKQFVNQVPLDALATPQ